jgi:hypothetical protein
MTCIRWRVQRPVMVGPRADLPPYIAVVSWQEVGGGLLPADKCVLWLAIPGARAGTGGAALCPNHCNPCKCTGKQAQGRTCRLQHKVRVEALGGVEVQLPGAPI